MRIIDERRSCAFYLAVMLACVALLFAQLLPKRLRLAFVTIGLGGATSLLVSWAADRWMGTYQQDDTFWPRRCFVALVPLLLSAVVSALTMVKSPRTRLYALVLTGAALAVIAVPTYLTNVSLNGGRAVTFWLCIGIWLDVAAVSDTPITATAASDAGDKLGKNDDVAKAPFGPEARNE